MTTTTAPAPATFVPGDEVTVDPDLFPTSVHGVVFVIEKVPAGARGVNYVARPKGNPTGRGVRAPGYALRRHDPSAPAPAPVPAEIRFAATPCAGTVITIHDMPKIDPADLYVVLGDAKRLGSVRAARLGGDEGRYWPSIPATRITVVDVATLTR